MVLIVALQRHQLPLPSSAACLPLRCGAVGGRRRSCSPATTMMPFVAVLMAAWHFILQRHRDSAQTHVGGAARPPRRRGGHGSGWAGAGQYRPLMATGDTAKVQQNRPTPIMATRHHDQRDFLSSAPMRPRTTTPRRAGSMTEPVALPFPPPPDETGARRPHGRSSCHQERRRPLLGQLFGRPFFAIRHVQQTGSRYGPTTLMSTMTRDDRSALKSGGENCGLGRRALMGGGGERHRTSRQAKSAYELMTMTP